MNYSKMQVLSSCIFSVWCLVYSIWNIRYF